MRLIDPTRSVVVLVDYQPRLMQAIHDAPRVLAQANRLAAVAAELDVPVLGTQQNPDRLGVLEPALAARCGRVLDKMHFDACGAGLLEAVGAVVGGESGVNEATAGAGIEAADVVVAGCESHVCLLQTALTLADLGARVWVCADASGARDPDSHELAMRRLDGAGVALVNVEMVAFEWLRTADHRKFRQVQALIK